MATSDVKLLGSVISPFVNRVQIALNLKSIKYEFLEEKFGTKSELLLKSNPVYKKIPVLIHNDKPVCESMIIVQYIDEVWSSSPSILPSEPYDRAIARFWASYVDDKWLPTMRELRNAEGEEAKLAMKEQYDKSILFLEDAFLKCSKGGDFFGGDNIGFIDIAVGSFLGWLKASEKIEGIKMIDEMKTPSLAKWAEKFLAHQAVESVIPETDKLVEIAKMLQAKAKAPSSS